MLAHGIVVLAAPVRPAAAGESGRRVGDEDEEVAALSKDGTTIALRKADRVRVVDLRQGRVGPSRLIAEGRTLLLSDQAGPLVAVDAEGRRAERLDAFHDGPARLWVRLPAHVVAATMDAGAGAVVVATDEAAPATTGGRGPVRLGRRTCLHRLPFVGGQAVSHCETLPTSAKTPSTRPKLLTPQIVHGHADKSLWWLSPRCTEATAGAASAATDGCEPGSRTLRVIRLDAQTLAPLGSLDTAADDGPVLPACAQAAIPGPLRVDVGDESVSFVSQRAEGGAASALWTLLPRSSGLAVGLHCLPGDGDGGHVDAVGNPTRALIGVGSTAVALDATRADGQLAIAAAYGEGAGVWQVAADGAHAALQRGRLLVAFDRNEAIGVATSRGILASRPSRLIWRDWERAIRSATWEEMVAVPPPPAGLDAVAAWLDVGLRCVAALPR